LDYGVLKMVVIPMVVLLPHIVLWVTRETSELKLLMA